ncbi:MAG TPA: hypothetical protein GXZ56_04715 [Bacteroidales bacterium]|jgi:hypothetical protein|nr:hypothetical protein [Bacteroidales bacterium]
MKKVVFILLFTWGAISLSAQEISNEATQQPGVATHELGWVAQQFSEQLNSFPHEKIYVQTDKSAYLSGERIWLRAHLVDAATNRPAFYSRYIYLELFNPFNELIERVKIRPDSIGVYSGYIDLEDDLAEGGYTLRAYTRYMRNQGNEAFFKKTIRVLDPYSLQVEPIAHFTTVGNKVDITFQFVDRVNGDTIAPDMVTFKLSDETTRVIRPKGGNRFNNSFTMNKRRSNRNLLLSIVYKGRKYERYYPIPYAADDFEVSFHPEGGYLVPGQTCQVGFKAINPSGLGEEVTGSVYNNNDEKVTEFRSHPLGMGSLYLFVKPNETYYAVCETKNGVTKRVELPLSEPQARTIRMRKTSNMLVATLLKGEAAPSTPVSLLIHHKGIVMYHEPWSPKTESYSFPNNIFPSGITCFLLLDENRDILSERLVFNINESDFARMDADFSAPAYKKRELITLKLKLEEMDTVTFVNNLAVSVIDKNKVITDTVDNLVSTLLLSSELQGHVESPATYFTGEKSDQQALDALLLTQGWRRYDIPNVLKGIITTPDAFQPEQFQEVSGKTEALLTSMKDGEISLMASLDTLISAETTVADEKGRFLFKVEYPEETEITVQSLSKRGGRHNLISLDLETFPDLSHATIPQRGRLSTAYDSNLDAYMQQANDDYALRYGIRTIALEEFTVTAQSKESYTESKFYSPITSSGLITADEIEKRKVSSLRSLLVSTPGLIVKSDRVTTTRSDMPVLFVIDDITYEDFFDQIDAIEVTSIDNMFIMKDNTFMLGYYPNTSGAVVITTKGGFVQKNTRSMNIDRIIPLGYQQPAEFYSPKYETSEDKESVEADYRTTIYWEPNVNFSLEGEAVIEFYSAASASTYQVIGEGVTGLGQIIHFTRDIDIEQDINIESEAIIP